MNQLKLKATTNENVGMWQLKDKTGALKYTYNGKYVVGVKGEPIKSTIVYKDADGAKQNVMCYFSNTSIISSINTYTSIKQIRYQLRYLSVL
jgi:hypothetical protein